MKVLLTGATGFLGSHLLRRLVAQGVEVVALLRRSSNMFRLASVIGHFEILVIEDISLKEIFSRHEVDIIIHCATDYGRKHSDPADILESNLIFPLHLLHCGAGNGVKCFINTDTILDKRVSHYSLSKNQFKEWLVLYSHDMLCINVALEHFYGPEDDPTKFVSYLVNSLVSNVETIDLTGGEQKRSFVYIDDVVDAFMKIIGSLDSFTSTYSHFEIGAEFSTSIREFAELAKSLAGAEYTELCFGALPYRENEVMEVSVDTAAIRKLGWHSITSLEKGIVTTIESARGAGTR